MGKPVDLEVVEEECGEAREQVERRDPVGVGVLLDVVGLDGLSTIPWSRLGGQKGRVTWARVALVALTTLAMPQRRRTTPVSRSLLELQERTELGTPKRNSAPISPLFLSAAASRAPFPSPASHASSNAPASLPLLEGPSMGEREQNRQVKRKGEVSECTLPPGGFWLLHFWSLRRGRDGPARISGRERDGHMRGGDVSGEGWVDRGGGPSLSPLGHRPGCGSGGMRVGAGGLGKHKGAAPLPSRLTFPRHCPGLALGGTRRPRKQLRCYLGPRKKREMKVSTIWEGR